MSAREKAHSAMGARDAKGSRPRSRRTFNRGGEPRLECSASARCRGCAPAVALIDTARDALENPARVAEARAMAEELLRPSWARALKERELFEAAATKPRARIEVW